MRTAAVLYLEFLAREAELVARTEIHQLLFDDTDISM
jgi:hypothetical protein